MHSVQTERQYIYVHRALLGYFHYVGYITDQQLADFHSLYQTYLLNNSS